MAYMRMKIACTECGEDASLTLAKCFGSSQEPGESPWCPWWQTGRNVAGAPVVPVQHQEELLNEFLDKHALCGDTWPPQCFELVYE